MKIAALILLILSILTGCSTQDNALEQATAFRKDLLAADHCSFHSVITADYGDRLYTFQMDCSADKDGTVTFQVTEPETIAGITGTISDSTASLTFDDQILAFPMLADGEVTPVSAPWLFLNTLRSGYIAGCAQDDAGFLLYIDDSYEEQPLRLQIQFIENIPVSAEIFWRERRVLTLEIQSFSTV